MKKSFIYMLLAVAVATSCQHEDENFIYQTKDNVYFGLSGLVGLPEDEAEDLYPKGIQNPQKTVYSFAIEQKGVDTVFIPISLSGKRTGIDRKFKVKVFSDSTSAEATLHYEPLKEYYIIPADSGSMLLPIILYNKDPEMETKTFYLKLELVSTDELEATIPEYKYAKIGFSNRLEKPIWWANWEREIGLYSRVKHALYLIALDDIEDKDLVPNFNGNNGFYVPYDLFLIGQFKSILIDPFLWVEDHTGYILEEREEGIFDFYSVKNEFKKYTLSYSQEDGKYYFMDENGKKVTTDL